MSSRETAETYPASGGAVVRASGNLIVAGAILGFFVIAAVLCALRKDIAQGFDEVAHVSYVAQIQKSGDARPALTSLRLLDPSRFLFTQEPNYLNHPPEYYAALARLGPMLEGRPQAVTVHRLINIALVTAALAALMALGLAAGFSREEFYAYGVPLAAIPVLAPLAGSVNNDNLAILGGAVATLGAFQWLTRRSDLWLAVALVGLIAAGWAKLTGLVLTTALLGGVFVYAAWRGRLRVVTVLFAVAAVAIASLPYLVFILSYGSPTPETPAQHALIVESARETGWADLPRLSFPGYLVYFTYCFVRDWMPALEDRSALNYAMLLVPAATLVCAAIGIGLALRRLVKTKESAIDVIVVAGTLAIAVTFAIHVTYSYGRYAVVGWPVDAYPRYYLPLAAIVPLACLSFLAAAPSRWRGALLVLLVAGPIAFRILGAPLG